MDSVWANGKTFTFWKTRTGEHSAVCLYECDQTGEVHVIEERQSKVYAVMPWDLADLESGVKFANATNAGIDAITRGRTRRHVNRTLKTMIENGEL